MHLVVHVGHVDHKGIAVGVKLALDRERVEVLCLVVGYLRAVHAEALLEIAESVEEAYSTHIDIAVGSLFQIVAGQHAETARIDLEHLVQTVLHAEISHGGTAGIRFHIHIGTEFGIYLLHIFHYLLVGLKLLLAVIAQSFEELYGIVAHFLIKFFIQTSPEVSCLIVPSPPHVVCELIKALELLRQLRSHCKLLPLRSVCIVSFDFHFLIDCE